VEVDSIEINLKFSLPTYAFGFGFGVTGPYSYFFGGLVGLLLYIAIIEHLEFTWNYDMTF
jgi:hypothetical protein